MNIYLIEAYNFVLEKEGAFVSWEEAEARRIELVGKDEEEHFRILKVGVQIPTTGYGSSKFDIS